MTKYLRIALIVAFVIFIGGLLWSARTAKLAEEKTKKEKEAAKRQTELTTSTATEQPRGEQPSNGFTADQPAQGSTSGQFGATRPNAPMKKSTPTAVRYYYYYVTDGATATSTSGNASASVSASGSSASASASAW